ncbi:MAG: hypothetical protein AAF564_03185 [Bacteroidota bacterium]
MEIVPIFSSLYFLVAIAFWIGVLYAAYTLFQYIKQLVVSQEAIERKLVRIVELLEEQRAG